MADQPLDIPDGGGRSEPPVRPPTTISINGPDGRGLAFASAEDFEDWLNADTLVHDLRTACLQMRDEQRLPDYSRGGDVAIDAAAEITP